jgi:hypothetical protein
MGEVTEEEKRHKPVQVLSDLIREFLAGRYSVISLQFNGFLELSEDEYLKLLGPMDSSGGADDVDVFTYITDVTRDPKSEKCLLTIKTLEVRLDAQENGIYAIHEVRGHTGIKETDCKDKEE